MYSDNGYFFIQRKTRRRILPIVDFSYYTRWSIYLARNSKPTKDKQLMRMQIRVVCRYLIYNKDIIFDGSYSSNVVRIYISNTKDVLVRNFPYRDM